ncbi:MAG TPA: VTT domain-containing protein [Verrucomicrobiae bacterium]|nr:VTT domain-containing protein [Verrucomicrobiae bacterium]
MVALMTADAEPIDEKCPERTADIEAEAEARPPWRKIALLALIVGVLLAIVYLSPLRDQLKHLREISLYIRGLGFWAPLALTGGIAALVAVGFPRLLFCVIAGMALGFWQGLLWAQFGTLLGNYGVFLTARSKGGDWARRYLSKRGRLHHLIQQEGILGVILARQLPVPGLLVNMTCGLVHIRHRHFIIGTIVGQLPEAVPCTLIGAGAIAASFGKSAGAISLAVAIAVALWVALRWFFRKRVRDETCTQPQK